jgi:protein TonB
MLISLLASIALHAAVLASAALMFGEKGTGPAESSSTLHVSVERIEPADDLPKDNPGLSRIEQQPEQSEQSRDRLKTQSASTDSPAKQEAYKQISISLSQPASDKKGADIPEQKPMQIAKFGNHARLKSEYQSRLQRLVERHKYYPLQARRNGIQGKATVSFIIRRNGEIENIVLSRSSGKPILDLAAIKTIKRLGKAPPFPNAIKRTRWRFSMPIYYNLR